LYLRQVRRAQGILEFPFRAPRAPAHDLGLSTSPLIQRARRME
jgi:hypothetical protein